MPLCSLLRRQSIPHSYIRPSIAFSFVYAPCGHSLCIHCVVVFFAVARTVSRYSAPTFTASWPHIESVRSRHMCMCLRAPHDRRASGAEIPPALCLSHAYARGISRQEIRSVLFALFILMASSWKKNLSCVQYSCKVVHKYSATHRALVHSKGIPFV
jgi:hypothetical protein